MTSIFKILTSKNQILALGLAVSVILISQHAVPTDISTGTPWANTINSTPQLNISSNGGNLLNANFLAAYFSKIAKKAAPKDEKEDGSESFAVRKSSLIEIFSKAE